MRHTKDTISRHLNWGVLLIWVGILCMASVVDHKDAIPEIISIGEPE